MVRRRKCFLAANTGSQMKKPRVLDILSNAGLFVSILLYSPLKIPLRGKLRGRRIRRLFLMYHNRSQLLFLRLGHALGRFGFSSGLADRRRLCGRRGGIFLDFRHVLQGI